MVADGPIDLSMVAHWLKSEASGKGQVPAASLFPKRTGRAAADAAADMINHGPTRSIARHSAPITSTDTITAAPKIATMAKPIAQMIRVGGRCARIGS